MSRVAVIGRGLWGAAAARHLASFGADISLIGPSEPKEKRTHAGVFASHWDEGRITRKNALDPYWIEVSTASIDRYAQIEAQSGIRFYSETGAVMAGGAAFMERVHKGREKLQVPCELLDSTDLSSRFPYFSFPETFTATYEPQRAGHISPRKLVAAQTKAASALGATVIDATVQGIDDLGREVDVSTDNGSFRFDHVLVASGYNSDRVLGRPSQMDVYARTVALFQVSETEAMRLASMPTLVYEAVEDPYLLPPIRYPDGKIYLKLGGDPVDVLLVDEHEIRSWFQGGGDGKVRDHLHGMIMDLMPDLRIEHVAMDACVTTWTQDRRPDIGWVSDRVAVCAGGNGAGAKCSDEMGRLGASLIQTKIGDAA